MLQHDAVPIPSTTRDPVLIVDDLKTHFVVSAPVFQRFRGGTRTVRAVDGVSLTIERGETVALVGESGCGKSTLGRSVLRLVEPTSGSVTIEGRDVTRAQGAELHKVRRRAQIIFQDSGSSLDPRMTVSQILEEPLAVFGIDNRAGRRNRVRELLHQVGLPPESANRYPHQFSGGQRQRIGIAAALALDPTLIIADEPTSALDVSVQAQILNLMEGLQRQRSLAYLFISHNLEVVRHISDRVGVMYLGKIVESGPTELLFNQPLHPYTRALLSAVPSIDPDNQTDPPLLEGEVQSPIDPPLGCRFHPRCPVALARCRQQEPMMLSDDSGHEVACHAVAWARAHQAANDGLLDPAGWIDVEV